MRFRSPAPAVAAAVCAALSAPAFAVDFSYSGFSTAAYAQSDTDEAQVGYIGQQKGIDSEGSWETDSKLGLQLSAKFNEMISATVQGVAYADLTADFEPHLDWAYLRVQALPSTSVRVGYMRAPTFMYSDSVFVGYANTWVRAPLEVYNLSPAYQLRGIDVTWRGNAGPVAISVTPYFGDSEMKVGNVETTLDVDQWGGLAATADYQSFSARVGYSRIDLGTTSPQLEGLVAALRAVPPALCGACASEAEHADLAKADMKILDIGGQYDDGATLAIVEWAQRRGGSYVVVDMHSAYATYGRRIGDFMPYATIAMARRDEAQTSDAIPATGPTAPLAAGVNAALAAANNDQDSYSIGLRYEVPAFSMLKGALIKAQYDHIDAKARGMLNMVQPGFDGDLNMVSMSFDFIF